MLTLENYASLKTLEKYATLEKKIYMSMAEASELSCILGERLASLDPPPQVAVGLANGAIMTTKLAADGFGIPFDIVRVRRKGSRIKQNLVLLKRLLRLPPWIMASRPMGLISRTFDRRFSQIEESKDASLSDVHGKTVVIIDDCIDTGSSVDYVRKQLVSAGAYKVHVAVLCWSFRNDTKALHGVAPDLYLHRRIHYYPWSNNSPFYKEFIAWVGGNGLKLWN